MPFDQLGGRFSKQTKHSTSNLSFQSLQQRSEVIYILNIVLLHYSTVTLVCIPSKQDALHTLHITVTYTATSIFMKVSHFLPGQLQQCQRAVCGNLLYKIKHKIASILSLASPLVGISQERKQCNQVMESNAKTIMLNRIKICDEKTFFLMTFIFVYILRNNISSNILLFNTVKISLTTYLKF